MQTGFKIFLVLLFSPFSIWGQNEYKLDGQVNVKNGRSFSYQLVFTVNNTELSGYSVTKLKNSAPTKASIKGTVNVAAKTISFTEASFENNEDHSITCFIHAVLSLKSTNNNYVLMGDFKGKDYFGMYCGHGTITFNQPTALYKYFGINGPSNTNNKLRTADRKSNASVSNSKKTAANPQSKTVQHPEKHPASATHNKKPHTIDTQKHDDNHEYEITSGITHQFQWYSDTCILEIYDGGVIDGDKITVIFNADEILTKYTLTKQKHRMKLHLKGKVSTISIIAENLGKTPPNTANFILTDGKRHHKIKAFNDIGESAEITLRRK